MRHSFGPNLAGIYPEVTVHINAHRAGFVVGVLMAVQYGELRGTAQGMPTVRIVTAEAKVFERPEIGSHAKTVVREGAVLDLIDKRDGWYWILLGRDQNGTRPTGWIQVSQVAIATAPTSRDSLRTLHEQLSALPRPVDSRKVEREKARKAAGEARAAAHLAEAARNVEEARRKYEALTNKPEDAR